MKKKKKNWYEHSTCSLTVWQFILLTFNELCMRTVKPFSVRLARSQLARLNVLKDAYSSYDVMMRNELLISAVMLNFVFDVYRPPIKSYQEQIWYFGKKYGH